MQPWGTWVAQSVGRLTSVQVMISQFVSSSSASASVLTARSLEPASDSVSPFLSVPTYSHSASVSLKNKQAFKKEPLTFCIIDIFLSDVVLSQPNLFI